MLPRPVSLGVSASFFGFFFGFLLLSACLEGLWRDFYFVALRPLEGDVDEKGVSYRGNGTRPG